MREPAVVGCIRVTKMSLWAIGTPRSGPLCAGGAAAVGRGGLGERSVAVEHERGAEPRVAREALEQVRRDLDARELACRECARELRDAERVRRAAQSITFGTRYRPSRTAGALCWLASRSTTSVTASARRRRYASWTAASGV